MPAKITETPRRTRRRTAEFLEEKDTAIAVDAEPGFQTDINLKALLGGAGDDTKLVEAAVAVADDDEREPVVEELEESTQAWLRRAGKIALLNHEQEINLAQRIERARLLNDELQERQAKEQLVMANLRLVASVARRYLGHGMPIEDLMQEGTIGLMRAVDRFNYRKGYRFSTYAIWWIRRSISRAIADQARLIRLPVHVTDTLGRINKTRGQLRERLGRVPTRAELAAELTMTEDKLTELLRGAVEPLSLEAPIGEEGESRLADLIPAADTHNPALSATKTALRDELLAALDELTPREKDVILLRYGMDGEEPRTLEEVGRALDVTRERVRQIESSALGKLRKPGRTIRISELMA